MTTRIYLDTETGPSRRMDVAAHLAAKHYDADKTPTQNAKAATDALARTSLSATLAELHVVGLAIDEQEPICLVQTHDGEAGLVKRFAEWCWDTLRDAHYPIEIWAYNAPFDRAILRVAAMRHRVRLPKTVHDIGRKPWESAWRCAMEPLRIDYRDSVSLTQACLAFGLGMGFDSAGDLPGSEVGAALARGELERVAYHCAMDVRRLREVVRHIRAVDEVPEVPVDEERVQRIMGAMKAPTKKEGE